MGSSFALGKHLLDRQTIRYIIELEIAKQAISPYDWR